MGPATEDLFQAAARGEVRLIIEESILAEAMYVLRHPQVDFADALLAASAADQEIPVASFDRDFDRFGDVVRFNPPSV